MRKKEVGKKEEKGGGRQANNLILSSLFRFLFFALSRKVFTFFPLSAFYFAFAISRPAMMLPSFPTYNIQYVAIGVMFR